MKLSDKCDASEQCCSNRLFFYFKLFSLLISLTTLPFIFSLAGELRGWVEASGVNNT